MKTMIEVRFQFEGMHHWPEAPEVVSFLRVKHRHMFHVRARMDVSHCDRDLEFILVKRSLQLFVSEWGFDLGRRSCEDMATSIASFLADEHKRTSIEVEVNEDGENGAVIQL